MSNDETDKVRLDKWLWAARFFKTRSLATDAINGGHVHVNGSRVKPSRVVCVGDELRVQKGQTEFRVIVRAISDRRGSAVVAQTLYDETDESREARDRQAEQQRLNAMTMPRPEKRPDKRQRRHLIRFRRPQD